MQIRRGRVFRERGERVTEGRRQQNGGSDEANQAARARTARPPDPDCARGKQVLGLASLARAKFVASLLSPMVLEQGKQ